MNLLWTCERGNDVTTARLAQPVERRTLDPEVKGSNVLTVVSFSC